MAGECGPAAPHAPDARAAPGGPGRAPPSNLTPAGRVASWTEAEFVRAMRTGRRPDGTTIDEFMPWRILGRMTDEEIHALWSYLRSVPAKPFGNK